MSNAGVLFVVLVTSSMGFVRGDTVLDSRISTNTRLLLAHSPYLAKTDITVPQNIRLTIDPGVQVRFFPQVTMKVRGTLIAEGTTAQRIVFTKHEGPAVAELVVPKRTRLVDGSEVRMGKLHVKYKSRWAGVCCRNREWSRADSNVACRELGFAEGNFTLLEVAENFTQHILYEQPKCSGNESSILDCPGSVNISLGSDVCHFQEVVSLQCWGINPRVYQHFWKGLEFFNTTLELRTLHTSNTKMNVSSSVLSFVDVEYAGVNSSLHHVGAISASPFPPVLTEVRLRWNAYDGLNYTRIKGPAILTNALFQHNRGHGMNISTAIGFISLDRVTAVENGGHGGDLHLLPYRWLDQESELVHHSLSMCGSGSIPASPEFPKLILAKLKRTFESSGACIMNLPTGRFSRDVQVLTLTMLQAERDPLASANITVQDISTGRLLATWPVDGQPARLFQGVSSLGVEGLSITMRWEKPATLDVCNRFEPCVRVVMQASVAATKNPEVLVRNSNFSANRQRGLTVKSPWALVKVVESHFEGNEFDAGLKVVNGSADTFVNASRFVANERAGLNITTAGGVRVVNASEFRRNRGHALDIHNQLWSRSRFNTPHARVESIVHLSKFVGNLFAMRFYNICDARQLVLVNVTEVLESIRGGIEMVSCLNWGHGSVSNILDIKKTNFTVGFSNFKKNAKYSIRVTPMVNMEGAVKNSTFSLNGGSVLQDARNISYTGGGGVIYVRTSDNFVQRRLYTRFPVSYEVQDNEFRLNTGSFVVSAQLVLDSSLQRLRVRYNRFLGNVVLKGPGNLNPRSSVHAVVVISSGNVVCQRNELRNPGSHYEIGTHLEASNKQLDVTYNYWGPSSNWGAKMKFVFERIFSQTDRHTLASLRYDPLLKDSNLYTDYVTTEPAFRHVFWDRLQTARPVVIGGPIQESGHNEVLTPGEYLVTRDIFIPWGRTLTLQPGVRLLFMDSVGLFVKGRLQATGSAANRIEMHQYAEAAAVPAENGTSQEDIGVRLVRPGGTRNETEGRVEVFMKGRWGTVCANGFTAREARVVCGQLGLVAHPDDWQLSPERSDLGDDTPIWLSTVRCQSYDLDLRECEADGPEEHSCSHGEDVRLRCHRRGWAGVRMAVTRQRSSVDFVTMTQGGLLDYFRMEYTPALMVDFNIHAISRLDVSHTLSDAIRVNLNAVWTLNTLADSDLSHNLGSGLALRSPYFRLQRCRMRNNSRSGLEYNPHFTEMETYQLRSFMTATNQLMEFTGKDAYLSVQTSGYEFITVSPKTEAENQTYLIELRTLNRNERLVVQLLDWNPSWKEENVTFFNAKKSDVGPFTPRWRIPEDLAMFPIISSGEYLTVQLQINGVRSNRLTMIVESKDLKSVPGSESYDFYPATQVIVEDSNITENKLGVSISHYNDAADRNGDIFVRRKEENVTFTNLRVEGNQEYAVYVPSVSRFARDLFAPSYSELVEGSARTAIINYTIRGCRFVGNGAGMFSDHNHVEYSNNVWHYHVRGNTWSGNRRGGFVLDLPFVSKRFDWRYEPGIDHIIDVGSNTFSSNVEFEFAVRGYFAVIRVSGNRFESNTCHRHLATFEGMEKSLDFADNVVKGNRDCTAMVHMDMVSQNEQATLTVANILRNNFLQNSCPADSQTTGISTAIRPRCYSVGVFGLQNATVQYNLLSNGYRQELIAGIESSLLSNLMDCQHNWWGTTDVERIRAKIFDFNDWNNYALVDFSAFLLADRFDAATSTATVSPSATINAETVRQTGELGGRINADLVLPWRRDAYRVTSDLTVLEGSKLRIEPGVKIEFAPNIGILVFGQLIARGTPSLPIRLLPMAITESSRKKRETKDGLPGVEARLVGGLQKDEGFLQFFNRSADRWDLVCDRQFSERTGRVVCRELGVETYNVVVRRTHLYDHYVYGFENPYIAKYVWTLTYTCRGDEPSRARCTQRLNYDVQSCARSRAYVFLRCGTPNLAGSAYWGNVRLASSRLEQTEARGAVEEASVLEHVVISGAGVLHGERVAALETVYVFPQLRDLDVNHCAWHGVDIIAPRGFVRLANSTFRRNLGRGFNLLVLNGDSSTNERTPFLPLRQLSLPAHFVYGLLDMCDLVKELVITDRVLVYYKYTDQTRACTKLFRSKVQGKRVAVRFLQLNLYEDAFTKNNIELFNGDNFNVTELLVELTASNVRTEDAMRRSYTTTGTYSIMGIHVHASPAGPMFGFLAELVTTPLSPRTYPDLKEHMTHSVLDSEFSENDGGAIGYGGVGELNPDLEIRTCRMIDNGLSVLNLTSPATVDMQMQNARTFDFSNNYVFRNRGGFSTWLYASSGARAIRGNITNNVVTRTSHDIGMSLTGNHFNTLRVSRNFIAHNDVGMRDIVRVSGVLMRDFSHNYIYKNRGDVILNVSGVDTLSEWSDYVWNGFYKNTALNYTRKTTVFCDSVKHRFRNNYFRNWENNYEMATGNMSRESTMPMGTGGTCPGVNQYCEVGWTRRIELGLCVCYRRDPVDARLNWWGEGNPFYVRSRIFDNADNDYLIRVDIADAYETNETVLHGAIYCPPTWKFANQRCFWYLGAYVDNGEAKKFCEVEANAILADSRGLVSWMTAMMAEWQNNYQWINRYTWVSRAWIYSDKPTPGECPLLRNYWVEGYPCSKRVGFMCQKSPYGVAGILHVVAIVCVSVVAAIFLITGVVFLVLWLLKSRRRKVERQVYRNTVSRKSMTRSKTSLIDGTGRRTEASFVASQSTAASTRPRTDSAHPGMVLADSVDRLDRAQVDELRSNRRTTSGSRSTLVSKPPAGSMASLDAVDLIGAQKDVSQRHQQRPMFNPTNIPMAEPGQARNRPIMARPQPYKNRPHPASSQGPSFSSNYDDNFSSRPTPSSGSNFFPSRERGYSALGGTGSTTDSEFDTDFDDSDSYAKKYPLPDSSSSRATSSTIMPPKYSPYVGYRSSETDV